jgi:hypothetical protein
MRTSGLRDVIVLDRTTIEREPVIVGWNSEHRWSAATWYTSSVQERPGSIDVRHNLQEERGVVKSAEAGNASL